SAEAGALNPTIEIDISTRSSNALAACLPNGTFLEPVCIATRPSPRNAYAQPDELTYKKTPELLKRAASFFGAIVMSMYIE
ncbi:MAG: hypothetical protein J4N66_09550, partial [Chloroflexi bacterium]|nr:hypothetical protein [Chloroflexota bacterium]